MPNRDGLYRAALGGLAAALVIGSALHAQKASKPDNRAPAKQEPQKAQVEAPAVPHDRLPYRPRCEAPKDSNEATLCTERKAVEVALRANEISSRNFWLSLAALIGLLVTIFYSRRATLAASEAVKVIPVLERAYVYPLIKSENVAIALAAAAGRIRHPMTASQAQPPVAAAKVVFKNFGKTPATLTYGEVVMSVVGGPPRVGDIGDRPIKYNHILGEGEKTEPFGVALDNFLTAQEAVAIEDGRMSIVIMGFMNYRDIWGAKQGCVVRFRYNPLLKRLEARQESEKEPAHGARPWRLPSHWWPWRKS